MDRLPKPCDCDPEPSEFTVTFSDGEKQIGDAVTYRQVGDKLLAMKIEKPDGAVRKLAEEN